MSRTAFSRQAVDDHDPRLVLRDGVLDDLAELAWRDFVGVEISQDKLAILVELPELHAQAFRTTEEGFQSLLEQKQRDTFTTFEGRRRIQGRHGRFSGTRLADDERGGSGLLAATEHLVQLRDTGLD